MPAAPSPQQIRAALKRHPLQEIGPLPGRTNHIHAAVLLPLLYREQLYCVATVRAAHMRKHAGEVCFPGGKREPQDSDLRATALREAREEIGLQGAEVLGGLSSMPVYTSDHRIFPFVGVAEQRSFTANPDEVAEVVQMPIDTILAQPNVIAIAWSQGDMSGMAPVFELGDRLMYGATAHAFYELLGVLAPLYDRPLPPLVAGRYTWRDVLPAHALPPRSSEAARGSETARGAQEQ